MLKALTAIPCIVNASVREAETGINELSVRQGLGGHNPIRRLLHLRAQKISARAEA